MPAGARERTTLDLRGLGPAIRAHAKARNLAVSSVARMAVAKMLESSGIAGAETFAADPEVGAGAAVKVTLRLPPRIARAMATRARATGLSQGGYVSTLINAAPVAIDCTDAVSVLAASTDRLASTTSDLNGFARLLRRGMSPAAEHVDDAVASLTREVRAHLRVAARVVSDLQPLARTRRDAGKGSGDFGATL